MSFPCGIQNSWPAVNGRPSLELPGRLRSRRGQPHCLCEYGRRCVCRPRRVQRNLAAEEALCILVEKGDAKPILQGGASQIGVPVKERFATCRATPCGPARQKRSSKPIQRSVHPATKGCRLSSEWLRKAEADKASPSEEGVLAALNVLLTEQVLLAIPHVLVVLCIFHRALWL